MSNVTVTIYTDPGCPFGFNAQRQELQLDWHYGHGADIKRVMIGLIEQSSSFEDRGMTREMLAANAERLRSLYGMPMLTDAQDHLAATIQACRAYVGARTHDPLRADLLLRHLRRRAFSDGQPLDEPVTLHGAGADAGIEAATLDAWLTDPEVERALREDMTASRTPLPEALALPHRLSGGAAGPRYSTASAHFESDARRIVMPGFQPFAVYEVAMANVATDLERRPAPETVDEVLAWAPYPLATAEVAELRGISHAQARDEVQEAGVQFEPAAGDGYWSI